MTLDILRYCVRIECKNNSKNELYGCITVVRLAENLGIITTACLLGYSSGSSVVSVELGHSASFQIN